MKQYDERVISEKQWNYCMDMADNIAKKLMKKDIADLFGKDGNANFCLNVEAILVAGTLSLLSKKINYDINKFIDIFCENVKHIIMTKPSYLKVIK